MAVSGGSNSSKAPARSRLEVNFLRVFHETQQMAGGARTKDWTFEKWRCRRRVLVLYGSETGTAQQVAERVAREAGRLHYTPTLAPMNDATLQHLVGGLPPALPGYSAFRVSRGTLPGPPENSASHLPKGQLPANLTGDVDGRSGAVGGRSASSLPAHDQTDSKKEVTGLPQKTGHVVEGSSGTGGSASLSDDAKMDDGEAVMFSSPWNPEIMRESVMPTVRELVGKSIGRTSSSPETTTGLEVGSPPESSAMEMDEDELCRQLESPEFLDQFYSKLPPLAVVFVAATTGQGDDPENMKQFFQRLWSMRQNRKLLSGLNFGVIALGDSSYQKFNYSGKRVNNLLTLLGGTPLVKVGLADDQHDLGPDFVVDLWLPQLWSKMEELFPLPDGVEPVSADVRPPARYSVTFLGEQQSMGLISASKPLSISSAEARNVSDIEMAENAESKQHDGTSGFNLPFVYDGSRAADNLNPCPSSITKLERVTAEDHFQDVRLVEFDVSQIGYTHKPGDVIMMQPQNLDEHVEEFLNVLHLDGTRKFTVEPADKRLGLQEIPSSVLKQPCSIAECVKNYFDIMSVPKRYFFELLSFFTTDEDEKEKFLEFASAQGQQDLYDYCNRPKRSIVEILADFPHTNTNIPFEYLFDLIPMIKPRAYSIASSAVMYPGKAQALVAVVKYKTILKRPRLGVCSNWLTTLNVGDKVNVWMKPGTLDFPLPEITGSKDPAAGSKLGDAPVSSPTVAPVIMVGPGTGCAPFRSYIQERIALNLTNTPLLLFFGCRNSNKDFFFKEEWTTQQGRKQLELYTAFSRDQDDKVYVQHQIREHWQRLWELLQNQETRVFFAGNAKRVPIDVHEALTFVCEKGLGDGKAAAQYMKVNLEKRYQTETWA